MKKKGFTVMELLTIIIMLAILSLILVPMILNNIETAKKESAEESAKGYIDAVEKAVVGNELSDIADINAGTYTKEQLEKRGVETKGNINDVSITINNYGQVINATFYIDGYSVEYNGEKIVVVGKVEKTEKITKKYPIGDIVYLDPETGKTCSKEEVKSNFTEEGWPTHIKAGCMKWYVISDESDKISMILDHNTYSYVDWASVNDYQALVGTESGAYEAKNDKGPITLKKQLENDVKNWKADIKATARAITAEEVANLMGYSSFDGNLISGGLTIKSGVNVDWLFDNTLLKWESKDAPDYVPGYLKKVINYYNYWTSTKVENNNYKAWYVGDDKVLNVYSVSPSEEPLDVGVSTYFNYGVRPVITISKNILK